MINTNTALIYMCSMHVYLPPSISNALINMLFLDYLISTTICLSSVGPWPTINMEEAGFMTHAAVLASLLGSSYFGHCYWL